MIKTWQERVALSNGQWPDDECMKAEIDELREAFANLHSDYDIIEIDREELLAKLAEKTESEKKWIALHGAVCDLHDKAKAKLAALEVMYLNSLADATQWQLYKSRKDAVIAAGMGKKAMRDSAAGAAPVPRMTGAALASQEPVAEVLLVDGEKVIDASMAFFDSVELGTKLYLAAGAAPAGTILTTIIAEIEAIDCYYYGDPPHEHCPFSIREKASDIVKKHAKQLEAVPVQHVFGGRVDPSYVSGPMEEAPKEQTPRSTYFDSSGTFWNHLSS